jgi:hypothetical protein
MSNDNNWPDDDNPGHPLSPETWGPHYLKDGQGRGFWAIWYPEGRWVRPSDDSHARQVADRWTYVGPAQAPTVA